MPPSPIRKLTPYADKAKKEGKKVNVEVETPKVKTTLNKDENKKEFVYDSKKLDINVTKDTEGTKVTVDAENGFLKKVGNFISKIFVRKFNKKSE